MKVIKGIIVISVNQNNSVELSALNGISKLEAARACNIVSDFLIRLVMEDNKHKKVVEKHLLAEKDNKKEGEDKDASV